jgi:alkylation response protein AidB-like acyl-CoA dehydrogenase
MDFTLTDEQRMFQKMFAEFALKEVQPLAEHIDRQEEIPASLFQKAAEQGFLAALIPEEKGGAGLDFVSYCLLLEELAAASMSFAIAVNVHNVLAVHPLLTFGTDGQKARYLNALAFGECLGAFALTEAGAGTDAGALATRATRDGDGYLLRGSKHWVTNGALAGLFVVFARTEEGISAFLVDRDAPGLKVGYREKTLGLRGLTCNTLYLDGCRVPAENLLGEAGKGMRVAGRTLDVTRVALGAISLGGARAALEAGVRFSTEREQFGGPIALKQIIQKYVADAATEVEAMRCLVYRAAWLVDQGQLDTYTASVVKLFASTAAFRIANSMLQVHGGYGYMKEYAIERMYRDFRALEIIEGTSQIQRFLIARKIYKDRKLEIQP